MVKNVLLVYWRCADCKFVCMYLHSDQSYGFATLIYQTGLLQ